MPLTSDRLLKIQGQRPFFQQKNRSCPFFIFIRITDLKKTGSTTIEKSRKKAIRIPLTRSNIPLIHQVLFLQKNHYFKDPDAGNFGLDLCSALT
jgi:hypothetical protein